MVYAVKEIYYTLQGEGANAGRAAVFCRFSDCNLWTGREEDRFKATCQFCDTDFVGVDGSGGGRFNSANALAKAVLAAWPLTCQKEVRPLVVCTGGEPLLQLDVELVRALQQHNFEVAVETNGTLQPPPGIDWVCVSPQIGAKLVLRSGNELKVVYPQEGGDPEQFENLDFQHFFLQPMSGIEQDQNTQLSIRYCLDHPQWRLSLQIHKVLSIP